MPSSFFPFLILHWIRAVFKNNFLIPALTLTSSFMISAIISFAPDMASSADSTSFFRETYFSASATGSESVCFKRKSARGSSPFCLAISALVLFLGLYFS